MALNEATLEKLRLEKFIKLALEYQSNYYSTLIPIIDIKIDLPELRKNYKNLESDLMVEKQVITKLCNQMKFLQHQYWGLPLYKS